MNLIHRIDERDWLQTALTYRHHRSPSWLACAALFRTKFEPSLNQALLMAQEHVTINRSSRPIERSINRCESKVGERFGYYTS